MNRFQKWVLVISISIGCILGCFSFFAVIGRARAPRMQRVYDSTERFSIVLSSRWKTVPIHPMDFAVIHDGGIMIGVYVSPNSYRTVNEYLKSLPKVDVVETGECDIGGLRALWRVMPGEEKGHPVVTKQFLMVDRGHAYSIIYVTAPHIFETTWPSLDRTIETFRIERHCSSDDTGEPNV